MPRAPARPQKTLNEDSPTDEDIYKIFDFAERKSAEINKVPFTLESEEVIGFGGSTYPLKDDFANAGFTFKNVVDNIVVQMWVAPADTNTADLEKKMIDYGFMINEYDGADSGDGGDDDSEQFYD